MTPDFIDMCQMFLVPASILFAAIGIAQTEALKALISLIGTVLGGLWLLRVWMWEGLQSADLITGVGVAGIFALASLISLFVHAPRSLAGRETN